MIFGIRYNATNDRLGAVTHHDGEDAVRTDLRQRHQPVGSRHMKRRDFEVFQIIDDDLVGVGVDHRDVLGLWAERTKSLALPHRKQMDALVLTKDAAGAVDDIATMTGRHLRVVLGQKVGVATIGDKTDLLAFMLLGGVQTELGRSGADFGLGHMTERKHRPS